MELLLIQNNVQATITRSITKDAFEGVFGLFFQRFIFLPRFFLSLAGSEYFFFDLLLGGGG